MNTPSPDVLCQGILDALRSTGEPLTITPNQRYRLQAYLRSLPGQQHQDPDAPQGGG